MLTEILVVACGALLMVVTVLVGLVGWANRELADLQRNRATWQRRAWSAERDLFLWQRRVRDLEGAAVRVLCALDAASLASDLETLRTVLTEPAIVAHNEETHGRKRIPDTSGTDCRAAE